MQISITIPTMRSGLRYRMWGRLGILTLAVLLTWSHGSIPKASANAAVSVSAGGYIGGPGAGHTCAVTSAGGVKCWGDNWHGDLGDGTTSIRNTPVDVSGLTSGVAVVAAGVNHTCAVTTAGGVKCWGDNNGGELGDGTITNRSTPVDVSGLGSSVAAVSLGEMYTCALTTTGGVKCWGGGYGGAPVDVTGLTSGVAAISAGQYHTCVLTTAGGVKCWGDNYLGELGDGQACGTLCPTPVDVVGLTSGAAAVSTGSGYTCAVTTAGGAKCWGGNNGFALGDGTGANRTTPVDVYGLTSGVAAISAAVGGSHTCALMTAGGLDCWGANASGQTGIGNTNFVTIPRGVYGLESGVASVALGGAGHTCAIITTGGLKCWGSNDNGQLGDGSFITRTVPGDVPSLGPGPKPTPGQINITNLGQYALPKTCFDVRDASQMLLFEVCDNDFQGPPASNAACVTDGVCNDEDPAKGSIMVTMAPGDYRVVESTVPPNHAAITGKQVCDASFNSCAVTFLNTPNTQPWHPWDVNGDGIVLSADITAVVRHYGLEKPLN